ncbi:hypothetical protein BCR36DRAFT_89399 [Piromyces finnis]|uniref:Uncharacterized protein n=1 Tax=Piromyces finnis TaxID=1754191 RepID=A0A1Y1VL62_9FUNG|nr:hypothetical protein BCR36DRAFT_89399 [Piromyces finnis]|eukprot:ORX59207.1 hypothetical protein BCR36DRAFT_89399 [Piromyces finnis]
MEYSECDYPHDERIRLIINFIIILIGCIWTYRMRYISHIFREPLAVPFYSYLIYKGIVFIMEIFCSNINNLSYLADSFGTILYSFIILYFLYFIKFYNIRFTLNKMDNRQHRASNVLTYIKQEKVFITSNYVMSSNVV